MKTENLNGPAPTAPPIEQPPGNEISVETVAKLEPVTLNIDMLRAALLCVSTEETRPYLNGVFDHRTHDGFVRAVSSDGHRMVVANLYREHADKPGPAWLSAGVIIPEGFALYDPKGVKIAPSDLEGQMVSPWVLERVDGDSGRSSDYKGKVLLIEFTGAGCGPCEQAIPFLKSIASTYRGKGVEVLSLETWETHRVPLKRFKDSHALNYEYLISNEEVNKRYMVTGVPMFMIVDKNSVIRKVLQGFGKGKTDQEISKILTQLP